MNTTVLVGREGQTYEVLGDGRKVWINDSTGSSVARFQLTIDIHRPVSEQGDKGQCLYCTHTQVVPEDWDVFVQKVEEHFGFRIPERFKPVRFLRGTT